MKTARRSTLSAKVPATAGPLEKLMAKHGYAKIADHCEMCGAPSFNNWLEPAFTPSGEAKILCRSCRMGSAELLEANRGDVLNLLQLVAMGNTETDQLEAMARDVLRGLKPVNPVKPSGAFDSRETATLLAALRHYQRTVGEKGDAMYPDHFRMSGQKPLTLDQIDDLAERINCGL